MRGFIAQGEFGWNPYGRSVEEFKSAHAQMGVWFCCERFFNVFSELLWKE